MLPFIRDAIPVRGVALSGMDYAHGTGHGVGNLLGIHEGEGLIFYTFCQNKYSNGQQVFKPLMVNLSFIHYYC